MCNEGRASTSSAGSAQESEAVLASTRTRTQVQQEPCSRARAAVAESPAQDCRQPPRHEALVPGAQHAAGSAAQQCLGSLPRVQLLVAVLMATCMLGLLITAPGRSVTEVDHVLAKVWLQRIPQPVEMWAGAKDMLRRSGARTPPERMVVAATLDPGTPDAHSRLSHARSQPWMLLMPLTHPTRLCHLKCVSSSFWCCHDARLDTDADHAQWLEEHFAGTNIQTTIYKAEFADDRRQHCRNLTASNSTAASEEGCWPHLASGKASEGSTYLQFIIDNYDIGLPQTTIFIHGHWESWHRPPGANFTDTILRLRWGEVPFANMRTWGMFGSNFWDLAIWISPIDPGACHNQTRNGPEGIINRGWQGSILRELWEALGLNDTFGLPPAEVRAPGCCGEFVVRRDRIYAHPKMFYVDLLERINSFDDARRSGYAMEHVWHVIFGEPWVTLGIGRCQLIHCSPEEEADPDMWPPAIGVPFAFHKVPQPFE